MRIVLFDVESFPNVGLTWGTWDQRVIKVLHRRMICSIAWQIYPSRKKEVLALCDMPGYDPRVRDNTKLIKAFAKEALDGCDIAVGHNIDEFDDPMFNTDVFLNKLPAPHPHRTIDTLKVCRHRFRLNSNKLNDVCQELGIGQKVPHPGIDLWTGCMDGDPKSWALMKKYNLGDVDPLLRGLYEHVRPWIKNHPNLGVDQKNPCCPSCGNTVLRAWSWMYSQTGNYQRMRCMKCGSWCKRLKVKGEWAYRP